MIQIEGLALLLAEASSEARGVFDTADRLLGFKLSSICFEGPADRLNATDVSQPALFTTSVAFWRACEAGGRVKEFAPGAMAGLSLGEYTALHLAGWISFEDGLRLVAERGKLMQAAAEASSGGMVSVMGLESAQVDELCREASHGEVLAAANFNCPGQIVISGAKSACERALQLADKFGARLAPITVAGAFHSPLMQPAVAGLEKALARTAIVRGPIGVVSNVSADYYSHPDEVRRLLREQVAMPIRWQASMERLIGDGFDRFVEVGAGRVLTGLMRKINRSVTALNVSTAADVAGPQRSAAAELAAGGPRQCERVG